LTGVFAGRGVRDAERAVNSVAVLERRVARAIVLVVARIAHVMGAEAAEECSGTAVLALPVDLRSTVRLTLSLASADLLKEAVLAQ